MKDFLKKHAHVITIILVCALLIWAYWISSDLRVFITMFVIASVAYYLLRTHTTAGTITIKKHPYPYVISNSLLLDGQQRNGIKVMLPVRVPHIFADMHRNDGAIGLIDNYKDVRPMHLESNFGTNSIVYAHESDRHAVLTLLNPATLQMILSFEDHFDVAFKDDCMFLLFDTSLLPGKKIPDSVMVTSAEKVLASLHQMFSNWQKLSNRSFRPMETMPDGNFLKIGRRRVGRVRILICLGFELLLTSVVGLFISYIVRDAYGDILLIYTGIFIWLIITVPILYIAFSKKPVDLFARPNESTHPTDTIKS